MRRGCISSGDIQCDSCHRIIDYLEPYLVTEEEGAALRLCVDCALNRGYARYEQDRRERIITFFPE